MFDNRHFRNRNIYRFWKIQTLHWSVKLREGDLQLRWKNHHLHHLPPPPPPPPPGKNIIIIIIIIINIIIIIISIIIIMIIIIIPMNQERDVYGGF